MSVFGLVVIIFPTIPILADVPTFDGSVVVLRPAFVFVLVLLLSFVFIFPSFPLLPIEFEFRRLSLFLYWSFEGWRFLHFPSFSFSIVFAFSLEFLAWCSGGGVIGARCWFFRTDFRCSCIGVFELVSYTPEDVSARGSVLACPLLRMALFRAHGSPTRRFDFVRIVQDYRVPHAMSVLFICVPDVMHLCRFLLCDSALF